MSDRLRTAIVIAKQPVPGRVKTRLTPPLTPGEAADVAAAALSDTLDRVAAVRADERILFFDGDPADWLPVGWRHETQPDGGLDERIAAAFAAAGRGPAVLVGMDTPQLRPDQLGAWNPSTHDACLALAADGGYWALGLADPALAADALLGIPMSTAHTGAAQLERLRELGLRVALLDTLTDVDTVAAAVEVARLVPGSRFAAAVDRAVRSDDAVLGRSA